MVQKAKTLHRHGAVTSPRLTRHISPGWQPPDREPWMADALCGQVDPELALSAAIDAWHQACHDGATIEDGMRRVVDAVHAAEVLPLAELVTDEDVRVATDAAFPGLPAGMSDGMAERRMRAALEAYGARLLARHGRTP